MAADPLDPAPAHADDFARAFPAIADRLAQIGPDPDLERLVEGFTALAQRVERVIDATSLRSVGHFAELLSPELLRPFPSATVLELSPLGSRRATREDFAAGAEFEGVSLDGTQCRFRAHAPFTFVPWRVSDAKTAWSGSGSASAATAASAHSLDLGLAPIGPPRPGESPLPLRLHFLGEQRSALLILAWMHAHLVDVEIEVDGRATALGRRAARAWGFAADEALLPVEPLEHPGLRLLRELMILPAKFAFVEVHGPPIAATSRAVLRFRFDTPLPPGVRVEAETIRTNCLPVVNAFGTTADPVRPSLERPDQPIRPASFRPAHGEVYSIREIIARFRNGEQAEVPPVTAFGAGPAGSRGMKYALERTPSRSGAGHDVSLAVAAEEGMDPEVDVLSIDLWATNRALPISLGVGDVRIPGPLSPRGLAFRNVRALSPYRAAPQGELLVWRVLALSALSARTLASRDSLRTLLHAFDLHAIADLQAGRAHAQKLEAIVEILTKPAVDHLAGASVRGHDVTVRLTEAGFDGEGEAFLFGHVLAHLFAHEASLNAFVRTTVHLVTTGRLFRFPALHGARVIG